MQSLLNFSTCLSKVHCHEEALEVIQEAVGIHRELASVHPTEFHTKLVLSLQILSTCLSKVHRHEEALEAIQEAVGIHQELATVPQS